MPVISQKSITRTIHATYLLSFLGDVSTGLFTFALSLYTSAMLDSLGISGPERQFWIGLVATGWGIVYLFSAPLLGKLSDRIGRRTALVIALVGFAVVNLFVVLFATTPLHLFFALCGVAFFFGFIFPVLEALISETTESFGQRFHARALSIFMIAWSLGLTFGPLIGGIFATFFNYITAFEYLIAHAMFFAIVVILFVPNSKTIREYAGFEKTRVGNAERVDEFFDGMPRIRLQFYQVAIVLLPVVFAFCNQIFLSIYPAFSEKNLSGGFILAGTNPAFVVGILIFVMGIGRTVAFWHTGRLPPARLHLYILLAPVFITAACMVIWLARTADILMPAFVLYGVGSGYAYSIGFILLMELSRTGKGMRAGLYEGLIGLGTLLSTLISTFIAQVDPASPYLLETLFAAATTAAIYAIHVRQKRS
jgi:MFS family permease